MKHMNVRDLTTSMQSRQARRNLCFDKVLEQCFTYVKKHADKNKLFCFYEVPEFQLGYPLYDLNECITYVVKKLESNDFLVRYFFPRILYISWNVAEIKEDKLKRDITLIKALEGPGASSTTPNGTDFSFTQTKSALRQRRRRLPRTISFQTQSSLPTITTPNVNANANGFVGSVKQFKPSGKIVLDL